MSEAADVSIGQAAALFGLTPATLRWWESVGVLPAVPRVNGRRRYTETELRRIGLAQLCSVTGAMPLEQVALVTAGVENRFWQGIVRDHLDLLERTITELRAARSYLLHLLTCPDDDIVERCTHLAGELVRRTPRGRIAATDLIDAARAADRRTPSGPRNEISSVRDVSRSDEVRCRVCGRLLALPQRGRPRRFCSAACRQRNHRNKARSTVSLDTN